MQTASATASSIAHESHNHPSQVVPFEGAATGVGGIVRDVLCMGAEVIARRRSVALRTLDERTSHHRYVAQGVVDGIAAYGNAIGVPNLAGDVYFDEGFDDNCSGQRRRAGHRQRSRDHPFVRAEGAAGWDIVLVGKGDRSAAASAARRSRR